MTMDVSRKVAGHDKGTRQVYDIRQSEGGICHIHEADIRAFSFHLL